MNDLHASQQRGHPSRKDAPSPPKGVHASHKLMHPQQERLRASPRPMPSPPGQPASIAQVGILHPDRDIALAVQHAPDIDMARALDVEHQMRV